MSTPKNIVVLGATGNIGTALVHHLLAKGHHVTAVARPSARLNALSQAGAMAAAGNLRDTAFLTGVLRGADAAFLMVPAPDVTAPDPLSLYDQDGSGIAQAVRDSGLRQAVQLSSTGADLSTGTGPIVGLHHQEARLNAIEGLTVAYLRPANFMENLLANIGRIQHMGIIGSAMRPDLTFPMVATKDIAAKAAELLDAGNFDNHSVHYLLGPRNYSQQEVTAIVGQAIGRPDLPYVPFSYEDAKKGMLGAGMSERMADLFNELIHSMNEEKALVHEERTAARTTPTTVEEFVRDVFVPSFKGTTAGQEAA